MNDLHLLTTYNILHILHILHTFKYGQISFTIIRKNLGVSNIEWSGMNVTLFILYTFSLKIWTTGKGALWAWQGAAWFWHLKLINHSIHNSCFSYVRNHHFSHLADWLMSNFSWSSSILRIPYSYHWYESAVVDGRLLNARDACWSNNIFHYFRITDLSYFCVNL